MQLARLLLVPSTVALLAVSSHDHSTTGTGALPQRLAATKTPVSADSETFVGEAIIGSHVFLPIIIQGHAATLMLDVGSDNGWLFEPVLKEMGIEATVVADSLPFGTSVVRHIEIGQSAFPAEAGLAPTVGLVGADVLSKYDLLVDGPAQRMRIYAPPAGVSRGTSSDAHTAGWLPAGITPDDCVPLEVDSKYPDRIFFPLQVNGHAIHSMFDSGSPTTNTNLVGAHALGINKRTPNVLLLPAGMTGQFMQYTGQKVWEVPSGLTLTIGARPLASVPLYIYQHLPRETGPDDPELSMGLDAISDRVMFVSYSTGRVCVGKPSATPVHAPHSAEPPAAPQVLLTEAALSNMTTFWNSWTQEPLAVRDTGRRRYQKPLPVTLALGTLPPQTFTLSSVVDMRGMAAHYPLVVTALAQAHLTADQWEQYREALFAAVLTEKMAKLQDNPAVTPTSQSVVAQNVVFLEGHQQALSALRATGMWFPDFGASQDFGGDLDP